MKKILLLATALSCLHICEAQLLKKIKDKVNKTISKDDDKKTEDSGSANADNSSENNSNDNSKIAWCDTAKLDGNGGISYTKIYSSPGKMEIVYNESSLGLNNDPMGYRLILSEYVNRKTQFVVVENGKVIDTDTKVKPQYLAKRNQSSSDGNSLQEEMQKYIVADSSTQNIPKTNAKSVTVKKVDDDQRNMAFEIMRQTDEYKNMSPKEQQELEENMKKTIAYNNSMAGKTIPVQGSAGGSYSMITGYRVVVKGKTYGKFMMQPSVAVSNDETSFLAVGMDDKAAPVMITQTKKTAIDKSKFTAVSGKMLKSPDGKKIVYLEQKQLTTQEMEEVSTGKSKLSYNVLRPDGTGFLLTDYSNLGKYRLTNTGAIINVNESTGEVYADNKKLGKFNLPSGGEVETDAIMIGGSNNNITYYDGSTGSLIYLDGSVKKMGIMFPSVITQNGKTYMSWFRKCKNDIYIGKFSY